MRKKRQLEPLTQFEAELWAIWDRLEKAVSSDFRRWNQAVNEAFLKLLYMDLKVKLEQPLAYNIARSYWLTARGRDHEVRAAQALWIASSSSMKAALKAALRAQQKAHLKQWKADQRAAKKAAKETR